MAPASMLKHAQLHKRCQQLPGITTLTHALMQPHVMVQARASGSHSQAVAARGQIPPTHCTAEARKEPGLLCSSRTRTHVLRHTLLLQSGRRQLHSYLTSRCR
jgi:hypothetical protein